LNEEVSRELIFDQELLDPTPLEILKEVRYLNPEDEQAQAGEEDGGRLVGRSPVVVDVPVLLKP